MNITTFTNNGLTARVFAGITLLSLLLSAFPVAFFVAEAATGIDGDSFTLDVDNDVYTATADTTGLENIVLTFNYDVSALDGDDENIVISYSAGGDSDTQTINGSTGDTAVAGDQELVTLTGLSADATLAISISADVSGFSGPASDSIELTNITVTGDPVADISDDIDTSEEVDEVPAVDFCDPSQKPGGKSIAQWHADNQFDGSSCFNYEVTAQCGSLDVQFTGNQTPFNYAFHYVIGNETPELVNSEGDGQLPVNFDEDENGGSVVVTYYVTGAEEDYFTGSDVPNIWDGNGETVTINTDCENDEPELEIPQQCSVVVDEIAVPADSSAGADSNVTLDNGRDYFAVVEGTYTFGNPKNDSDRLADAEYSLDAGETDWVKEFGSTRPDVLDLFIDGTNPDFGTFRSDHTYGAFFSGTGAASNFAIQDNPHSDNSGELDVTIYECELEEEEPEVPQVCSIAGEVVAITEDAVKYNGSPVDSNRRSTTSLETAAPYINFYGQEGNGWSPADFLTLGVEGSVTYKFTEQVATDKPGDDIAIWEITGGDTNTQSNASAIVEVSQDGVTFVTVDTLTGDGSIDIAGTGLDYVQYIRLTDDSAAIGADDGGDGYDVDAITIINDSCASIPEPTQCTVTLTSDDTNTVVEKSGAFAVVLDFIHNTWTTSLANADWIWGDQGPTNPAETESQTFVNQFGWNGDTITDATLTIAADNSFVASLNGDSAAEELGEFNYSATKDYDVTELIESGNNELAVIVENFAGVNDPKKNPAGLYYELVINGEGENCEVPYVPEPEEPEEPEYGPYCGDGEINQQWEQCDGGDTPEGESCTDYCTLDNQCTSEQLVKITLDDTAAESVSFNGQIYLGSDSNPIPNGTWFSATEVGDGAVNTIAQNSEGLAVSRAGGELQLAVKGDNKRNAFDYVVGSIETQGIDLGATNDSPVVGWPLEKPENGYDGDYPDSFEKSGNTIDFDWKLTTGDDSASVALSAGEAYNCPECKATVEARVVLDDSGSAGAGSDIENIVLGDATYSTVEFGEWFPVSLAANPGDSAVMINDPNTVTNFDAPADKPGLFVSREDGTVKVALYGEFANGKVDFEWIDARIEIRDAEITNYTPLAGNFKFENHPENDSVASNDGYDEATADNSGVDFKLWVDTGSDGFRFNINSSTIVACDEDTEPEPQLYAISGVKWADDDGDGIYDEAGSESDSAEDTISGWVISLLQDGVVVATTTTDGTGEYSFDVESGIWTISEEQNPEWTQTGLYKYGEPVSLDGQASASCTFTVPEDGQAVDFYTCSFGNQENEDPIITPVDPEIETESGGGSGSTGTRVRRVDAPNPLVLGATTDAPQFCPFLTEFMQIGAENDQMEVMKLQLFLNVFKDTYGGTENPITGTFGSVTDANVKAFQEMHRSEVLDPWFERGIVPHDRPTGFVYKTTLWKINSIVCPDYAVEPDFTGESLDANVDNNWNDIVRD